ncbi:hypothetical protein NE237_009705 [Protea cynaroides]|uniref:Uncharacterized protein n=1 Tax=Protea cynaroides TaxID=273540 RepID=A0A9Q0R0I7_9MAGN|nr:hypothetical protein NE237_009705 [Protea cynaroides]
MAAGGSRAMVPGSSACYGEKGYGKGVGSSGFSSAVVLWNREVQLQPRVSMIDAVETLSRSVSSSGLGLVASVGSSSKIQSLPTPAGNGTAGSRPLPSVLGSLDWNSRSHVVSSLGFGNQVPSSPNVVSQVRSSLDLQALGSRLPTILSSCVPEVTEVRGFSSWHMETLQNVMNNLPTVADILIGSSVDCRQSLRPLPTGGGLC